jgi:tRNA(Ile)-lysidine synthase
MSDSAILTIENSILTAWPISHWSGMTIAIGCSGGPDSVALLCALKRLCPSNSRLLVLHFNHQLRGPASDGDEQFVRDLAASLHCIVAVGRADGGQFCSSSDRPMSWSQSTELRSDEAHLRAMRYSFFESIASSFGARYVALAHSRDDQIETSLLNLFRGTGLAGLSGMKPFRPIQYGSEIVVARPLLGTSRRDIELFLSAIGQAFRTDASNSESAYTRNWLRNELMPIIEERMGSSVRDSIARFVNASQEIQQWIESSAKQWCNQGFIQCLPNGFRVNAAELTKLPWPVIYEVLRASWIDKGWGLGAMSHEHWLALRTFIHESQNQKSVSKPTMLPGAVQVQYQDGNFSFQKLPAP